MTATLDRVTWFGTPILATLAIHLGVLALLVVRWSDPATIEARVIQPVAIKASLVSAESLRPKPKPKSASTSPPKQRPKPKPKPKPEPTPREQLTPAPKTLPKKQPPAEPAPVEEAPRLTEQDVARETLADIESLLASEQRAQPGVTASPSDTAAALIRQAVIGRWTRPPSARNGMVAVLEIALVPTGDVVGVTVLETSGNVAFDRSAMNAVDKVGRFPEVSALERAVFERDFRRFQLIFRPEDLRY
ncbi:MAG: TonB family protein [Cellvibrionales bacterium]